MKILSYDCHEGLLSMFANLDIEFDLLFYLEQYKWRTECKPIPKNINILDRGVKAQNVNKKEQYDLVLVFNRHYQYQQVKDYPCPVFLQFATGKCNEDDLSGLEKANIAFCSFSQMVKYGYNNTHYPVIYYGVGEWDYKRHQGGNGKVLTVNHDFRVRDNVLRYYWSRKILEGIENDNYGFQMDNLESKHSNSYADMLNTYFEYSVYFDTAIESPLSMSMLEAMSAGMPVVTTFHDDNELIFENDVNGIISNDDEYLKEKLKELLSNKKYRKRLGDNARDTIKQKFSIDKFKGSWEKYIRSVL